MSSLTGLMHLSTVFMIALILLISATTVPAFFQNSISFPSSWRRLQLSSKSIPSPLHMSKEGFFGGSSQDQDQNLNEEISINRGFLPTGPSDLAAVEAGLPPVMERTKRYNGKIIF
jgi:hypothetical protein